jgi:hypothetical protein
MGITQPGYLASALGSQPHAHASPYQHPSDLAAEYMSQPQADLWAASGSEMGTAPANNGYAAVSALYNGAHRFLRLCNDGQ